MNNTAHIHEHKSVNRRYCAPLCISEAEFPSEQQLFFVHWIPVSILIFFFSLIFIYAPLHEARSALGGPFMVWVYFLMIYVILIGLYALYYMAWMRRYKFQFFEQYIMSYEGVFRRVEKHVRYASIHRVYVRRGMFEKIFGLASTYIENAATMTYAEGSEPASLIIPGQTLIAAGRLVETIESVLHGRGGNYERKEIRN